MAAADPAPSRARRPPRPAPARGALSAEAVVVAARELVAEEGLDAVSMRTLAARLRCTPRALYRHVDGKDAVLELLADALLADVPEARRDVPWPEALVGFFVAMREHLVAEPALTRIVAERTVSGPHFRRHADRLTAILLDAGLDEGTAVEAVVALAYYTLGASLPGTGRALQERYRVGWDAGVDEELPAWSRVAERFAGEAPDARFRAALVRMVDAYRPARGA